MSDLEQKDVNTTEENVQQESVQKEGFLERRFRLKQYNTTVRTEIMAGLTTFFALCYIVLVNPNQMTGFYSYLGGEWQGVWNACFVGGLLGAVIATFCMAFIAKQPYALAAGMGLNSFFFVSFLLPAVISNASNVGEYYGAGLAAIFISGLLFLILSITGVRSKVAKALPDCLKKAIPAGIGLFIALIGMKNAFMVTANQYTFVQLANLSERVVFDDFGGLAGGWAPFIAAFVGFLSIAIFNKSKLGWMKKGSIVLGILVSTVLYYLCTWTLPVWNAQSLGTVFGDFAKYGLFNLRFDLAFDGVTVGSVLDVIMVIIAFSLVDIFDTIGTVYGTAAEAGLLDEAGDPVHMNEVMLCDSIGTAAGAALGTSTITTFVESSAGVAAGGKTGLTAAVTATCLLLCLFISPIASIIPTVATAPALIYVGVLMLKNFKAVDMNDVRSSVPAFLALAMMPLTYSISNGIGIGAIAYVLITLFTGEYKKSDITVTIIAILFALRFFLVQM